MNNPISEITELRNKFEARKITIAKEMQEVIDLLERKIEESRKDLACTNEEILCLEVMNLINGIGIKEEDDYAPKRIYSKIKGVKNIRFDYEGNVLVKITSPSGYLLPEYIKVFDVNYSIVFDVSKNYKEELDF